MECKFRYRYVIHMAKTIFVRLNDMENDYTAAMLLPWWTRLASHIF